MDVVHETIVPPGLIDRLEDGTRIPVLIWRPGQPMRAISSGPLGGGLGLRHWVLNATVPMSYARPDPDAHLAEIASALGLAGSGVGMLTGVDVGVHHAADDGGVSAVVTVGLGTPAWAAAPDGHLRRLPIPGTINAVVCVPVTLSDAALVNAVATVAEAKAQALWDLGIDATGTPSDATCVICPAGDAEEVYGGPRSTWGARIARAVHASVRDGGRAWQAGGRVWRDDLPADWSERA
jgi:adenosylcobinamide hydrolase